MIAGTIAAIRQETPTIKVFSMNTPQRLIFQPGQWVDCYVEVGGRLEVGGYSLTSAPGDETVELGIKQSRDHPVTRFLHEQASQGTRLLLDGGYGECVFEAGMPGLVLVAGGIGITPMMSIIRHTTATSPALPITLLYSAASDEELAFRADLDRLAKEHPSFTRTYFATRTVSSPGRRIDRDVLRATLDSRSIYFVCGPRPMIDEVVGWLDELAVPRTRIRFERW